MPAVKHQQSVKAPAGKPAERTGQTVKTALPAQVNPVWQQLATRVQTRLSVGAVDDPLEREADRVAGQVMRMPDSTLPVAAVPVTALTAPAAQRSCAACEEEDRIVRRQPANANGAVSAVNAEVETQIDTLEGRGRPLQESARAFFEPRFGTDFSAVRVHTDSRAAQAADALRAEAFTSGRHIVFAAGEYAPATDHGRHLLAHELTHVMQQSQSAGVIARRPRGDTAQAPTGPVRRMTRDEARAVLADEVSEAGLDDSFAAMNAIQKTLDTPSTAENWKMRLQRLSAAFSLLDNKAATLVLKALTVPAGAGQEHLQKRFLRLDADFRRPLLQILREQSVAQPAPEPAAAAGPQAASAAAGNAGWLELYDGVFAYVAQTGMTLNQIAAYLSGHPDLPDALVKLNDIERATPLAEGQSVIVPVEFIDREKAIRDMPADVRRRIAALRQAQMQQQQYQRFVQVRGGHPLGPGAVGLFPVTTLALQPVVSALLVLIKKAAYAIAFVAGVVHGFLASVWDAVAGIAKLIYEILKSIVTGELISDIKKLVGSVKKLSWDKIREALGEWAAGWDKKLKSADPLIAGHAHGYLTGYVMAEVAMLLLSGGVLTELKGAIWSSRLGELVKGSRAVRVLEASVAKVAQAGRAGGDKVAEGLEALRRSRLGKVVKAAEVTAAAVGWSAAKVIKVLNLPADIAVYVADKMVTHVKRLETFFPRIRQLSDRAKRWLFGCRSPCEWEADAVSKTMTRLGNGEIEARAAGKVAAEPLPAEPKPAVAEPAPAEPKPVAEPQAGNAVREPEITANKSKRDIAREETQKKIRKIEQQQDAARSKIAKLNKKINELDNEIRRLKDKVGRTGGREQEKILKDIEKAEFKLNEEQGGGLRAEREGTAEELTELSKKKKNLLEALTLERPSLRAETKRKIEANAPRAADGRFLDRKGRPIDGPVHYGHIYGKEHRRLALEAQEKGMNQSQFNDWVNDHPQWFQVESKAENLSHAFEKPGID